ncbi:MAG: NPCBM/NEW2 domain-containing protein [Pirellulales bacterium]
MTVGGEAFRGTLVSAVDQPAWAFRFADGANQREVPAEELATWGNFVDPGGAIQVVLAGGGLLVVDDIRVDGEQLVCTSALVGSVNVPLKLVSGILLQQPALRAAADQLLARVLAPAGENDRVILDNRDELAGSVLGLQDGKLKLQADVGVVELAQDKLAAVIFNPALIDKPSLSGLRVLVGWRDGSRATALSLVTIGPMSQVKLPGGVTLTAPTESIVALQPLGGRAVYLSDLKPSGYRHIPFLELTWPLETDRSVTRSLLRAGDHVYLKGLGMHSPARVSYDLDGEYRQFVALVAIDAGAGDAASGPRGSVVFRVFVDDGSGAWQERAKSAVIRGGEPPVPLVADLRGARRISLLVDFADRGDECDHADWLNARLVR